MTEFRTAQGDRADHVDADDLVLFTNFDLRTGAILSHGRATSLALAKLQETTAGDDAPHMSFVLGHWDAAVWRITDGEPVPRPAPADGPALLSTDSPEGQA